jgi:hypothetical protein
VCAYQKPRNSVPSAAEMIVVGRKSARVRRPAVRVATLGAPFRREARSVPRRRPQSGRGRGRRRERRESGALRRDSRRQVVPDRLDRYRVPDVLEERASRRAPRCPSGNARRSFPSRGALRPSSSASVGTWSRLPKATEQRTERCGDDRRGAEIGAREIRVEDRDERHDWAR